MQKTNQSPTDPKVTARILKRIDSMTPEELADFLACRTPGIEETDMTGMLARSLPSKRSVKATNGTPPASRTNSKK